MLKRKICVLGVVFLMLVAAQIALIKPIKSYPACYTGNAYVGEFWLEQMDVSSANLSYNKTGTIHVCATNDWIVYEDCYNFIANWTIETGWYHPELNVSMVIEVFYLNNTSASSMNFYKEIGNASYSITIPPDTNCDKSGNISVPLSDLNLEEIDDDNVTVICLLTGAVLINNTEDTQNLIMMTQDRSVVGVEKARPPENGNFSFYINMGEEFFPNQWSCIPGYEETGMYYDIQSNQTVVTVGKEFYAIENGDNDNDILYLGEANINVWQIRIKLHHWTNENSVITWYVENGADYVYGPVWVNYSIAPEGFFDWRLPVEVTLACYYLYGFPFEICSNYGKSYWENEDGTCTKHVECTAKCHRNYWKVENEQRFVEIAVWFFARLIPIRVVAKIYIEETDDPLPSDYSTSWSWEEDVAYGIDDQYEVNVYSDSSGSVTIVNVNLIDFLKNADSDELIYLYAADRGSYVVDLYCGG